MKLLLPALLLCLNTYAQKISNVKYFLISKNEKNCLDTSLSFVLVQKGGNYTFVFSEMAEMSFRVVSKEPLKLDTLERKIVDSFGPYQFKKAGKTILFKRNKNVFQTLYINTGKEFVAPNLLSTDNSYNIVTRFIDSISTVNVDGRISKTYKYEQIITYDFGKLYSLLFIDRHTLIPLRIEYYSDIDRKNLVKVIFR